jgi:hypothetical protein
LALQVLSPSWVAYIAPVLKLVNQPGESAWLGADLES